MRRSAFVSMDDFRQIDLGRSQKIREKRIQSTILEFIALGGRSESWDKSVRLMFAFRVETAPLRSEHDGCPGEEWYQALSSFSIDVYGCCTTRSSMRFVFLPHKTWAVSLLKNLFFILESFDVIGLHTS